MMFGGRRLQRQRGDRRGQRARGSGRQADAAGTRLRHFGSDSGHQANATGSRDGSFGVNDEALHNFAGDALKKTRGRRDRHHRGALCARNRSAPTSPAGPPADERPLLAVGNWPADFDGAIVLYPAWNATALNLQFGRMTQALRSPMRTRAARSAR
jgi:feruloyl esterase